MKILLTAQPRTGKSTVLEKVSESFKGEKFGIITKEIRDDEDKRVGFEAVNPQNQKKVFMHISDIESDYSVGNKYKVDVDVVSGFMVDEILRGKDHLNALVFIDELGRAEAFSEVFLQTIRDLFPTDTNFLGTIVYDDEPWSREFKENDEVVLLVVTMENRDYLPKVLTAVYENIENYHKLNSAQKRYIKQRFKYFITEGNFIMAYKLFNNTIKYFAEDKIQYLGNSVFVIKGDHGRHFVTYDSNFTDCDCKLFNREGEFSNEVCKICSHVESVRMFMNEIE